MHAGGERVEPSAAGPRGGWRAAAWRRCILMAALGAGSACGVLPAGNVAWGQTHAVEPEPPRIHSILFPGAEAISPGDLRHVMRLRQRAWWRPFQHNVFLGTDQLERDLERVLALYHREGYVLARVEEATVRYRSQDWVDLEIRLNEGRRTYVRGVRVEGAPAAVRSEVPELESRPREPLHETRLTADEERVQQFCEEEGYAFAAVTRELRFEADSVEVIFWVDRGPLVRVDDITVVGLTRTRPSVVRREMRFHRGDIYRRSRAVAFQERLFDLGLFRTVRILPALADSGAARSDSAGGNADAIAPPDSGQAARDAGEIAVDLRVTVAEKAPGWYGLGLGYSSADQVRLLAEWGYRNLMGRARAVQVGGMLAYSLQREAGVRRAGPKERQIEVIYTEPWMWSPLWGQVRAYARTNREATFEEDVYGLVFGARRDLTRYERLLGSIENKWVSTTDTTAAKSEYQTRFLSLALATERRDFPLDPHRGSMGQARVEYAGGFLGGAASFLRTVGNAAAYVPLGPKLTWAYRVRAGYVHPIGRGIAVEGEERDLLSVPFDERFRAGGGTTVRGYSEGSLGPYSEENGQALGGLLLMLANVELRFPIAWLFSGTVFLDAGNVWADYRQMNWSRWARAWESAEYSALDAAYGFGVGLRFTTPVGPLRLDYGVKVGEERPGSARSEWHFSLGQAF